MAQVVGPAVSPDWASTHSGSVMNDGTGQPVEHQDPPVVFQISHPPTFLQQPTARTKTAVYIQAWKVTDVEAYRQSSVHLGEFR